MASKEKRDRDEPPMERKTVGGYNLGAVIGKGGFGTVFQGLDVENGDFVAVKQINLTKIPKDQLQGIMNEIDLLKNLNHANIVKYIRYVKTKECLYIVLEYVENGSLSSIIKKFGKFPETLVSVYIRQVLEGLVYLHEQGVVHRDIKGANILTTKEGKIKLADFGVATKFDDLQAASVVGTPYWMAPEIIELNGCTTKSDIWSVGCTVIELLTGQPPYYDLGPMPALFRIVQDDCPTLPEGISPALKDWLMQCFQKDPNLRISAQKLLKHKWIALAQKKQAIVEEPSNIEDLAKNIQDYNERINKKKIGGHQRKPSLHPKSPKQKLNLPPPEEEDDEWGDDFSSTPKSIKLPDQKKSPQASHKNPAAKKAPISPPPQLQLKKRAASPPPLKLAARPDNDEVDWDDFDVGSIKTQDLSKALGKFNEDAEDDDGFGDVEFPTAIKFPSKQLPTSPASKSQNNNNNNLQIPQTQQPKNNNNNQSGGEVGGKKSIDQWGENDEDWGDVATVNFTSVMRKGTVHKPDLGAKLKSKLNLLSDTGGDDEDDDPFNEAFDDFDEDFDLDKNLMKDNYARMSEEILKLMSQLQIDQSEQVISSACDQLITIFKENPDQKSHLIRRHGVIPIMEMLEVSNSHVLCSILKVVNQIIDNNMEIQENLCLVGGIPSIMKFAGREYDANIRLETASFVSKMCSTSTLTLQMFIACKGLPILVDFLATPYQQSKRLVCLALDAIVNVFELQSPTPKNDFCRLFSKVGLMRQLPVVLGEVLINPPSGSDSINQNSGSQHNSQHNSINSTNNYPDKIINLLILFSSADSVVRRAMSCVEVIEGLLATLDKLLPDQLVKVLKSIKQLSMDHNTLASLQAAGTIGALIPYLARHHSAETQNQVINTMFHLCRIDAERQYLAAAAGIIPHLLFFITTHSPLNQFALPIICDLAHSKKARAELWNHNGVEFYINLLQERYWQVNALDSLAVWMADETSRVEAIMSTKDNISKLTAAFASAESQSFVGVLDPILKIVSISKSVNVALGTGGFVQKLLDRLSHTNPLVRLNLLKILSSLYEHHPNTKMMIQEYKLYPIIQRITTSDKSVLNQKIASKLYEAFNTNSVI
ncbi:putative protein serine/threonine kinase [Cavenderia fasciculata]|uniref:non-specific serine/threonine protein kinase n=1 Tax=Cavenderia fasciculata TaxID=261658 RepID=F4PTN2_CACFS|nr:putative protein serine/threonine kinase [Cavenderia fasciculata]EGG21702.1 putative protein serine/threonine kinase [Cavenderia fasciculata]|eukprot:XP_004359552.1 putative protein serine/threonine kinase [Cavenderia fasciculata]